VRPSRRLAADSAARELSQVSVMKSSPKLTGCLSRKDRASNHTGDFRGKPPRTVNKQSPNGGRCLYWRLF